MPRGHKGLSCSITPNPRRFAPVVWWVVCPSRLLGHVQPRPVWEGLWGEAKESERQRVIEDPPYPLQPTNQRRGRPLWRRGGVTERHPSQRVLVGPSRLDFTTFSFRVTFGGKSADLGSPSLAFPGPGGGDGCSASCQHVGVMPSLPWGALEGVGSQECRAWGPSRRVHQGAAGFGAIWAACACRIACLSLPCPGACAWAACGS
jgi:hypothetical protein